MDTSFPNVDDGQMLNLNDMRYFVQVMDARGFSPAARQLGIPKSTLSKRVAALELALDVRLIQRTSRRFVATNLGRDFYLHAKDCLTAADAAEQVVRARLAEPNGVVRLTASIPTAQLRLAALLPKLLLEFPRLSVDLHASDRYVDMIQEGFDIAVRDHFGPLVNSELVGRVLGSDPLILVASRKYLRGRSALRGPEELESLDGVSTSRTGAWNLLGKNCERAEVRLRSRLIADESTVLLQAAVAGLGVTCLPRELCLQALEAKTLVQVLPQWTAGVVWTTALTPHRRAQLPSVRAVLDALSAA